MLNGIFLGLNGISPKNLLCVAKNIFYLPLFEYCNTAL